jgi:hypothetical protein
MSANLLPLAMSRVCFDGLSTSRRLKESHAEEAGKGEGSTGATPTVAAGSYE